MTEILDSGNLSIVEFSFHAFLVEFQSAVQNGYVLNLEDNAMFPQKYMDTLSVVLAKPVEGFKRKAKV